MRALHAKPVPTLLAAGLVAVIAAVHFQQYVDFITVHFQQYVDFISQVQTVGVLFLLNAAGGAGLAVALLSNEPLVRRLAPVGALGLAIGSLISIAIALGGNFFGYSEPNLRLPIVIPILAEAAAIPTLILLMLHDSRAASARLPASKVAARPRRQRQRRRGAGSHPPSRRCESVCLLDGHRPSRIGWRREKEGSRSRRSRRERAAEGFSVRSPRTRRQHAVIPERKSNPERPFALISH